MSDLISKNRSLVEWKEDFKSFVECLDIPRDDYEGIMAYIDEVPYAEPERLTDDDFETIRIHLNAYKEKLCNQQRWEEAEEYQRIIDRFMAFASAEPEPKKGEWINKEFYGIGEGSAECSICHKRSSGYKEDYGWGVHCLFDDFCPNCGADMRGE